MCFFEDDITWCANSMKEDGIEYCDNVNCFRHLQNRKSRPILDVFTLGLLKDTTDCPYFNKGDDENV